MEVWRRSLHFDPSFMGIVTKSGLFVAVSGLAAGAGPPTREAARRACRIVFVASMISGAVAVIACVIAGGR